MDIPTGPADLTPAWLSEALTASGVNAEVRAVDVADGSAGRGFACQILRLTLAYAAEVVEAPRSLIAKLPRATSGEPALWAANEIA